MKELALKQSPIEESPDIKYLKTIASLEVRQKEIKKAIENESDNEVKRILEMDLEDMLKKIDLYKISDRVYRNKRKTSALKEIAGDPAVNNALDFKKKKNQQNQQKRVILNEDEQKLVSKSFMADLENFKESRKYDVGNNRP